nr:MFS transporter [Motilibacter aurantiacus]
MVQFVDVLGVTSATTAIPAVLRGLDAPASAAGPLATAYAMVFGGLLVLGARLGDRVGHRRVLLAGITGYGGVSLAGALAQDVVQVVAVRGLQGAAAAVSVPAALRLLLAAAQGSRTGPLAAWSAAGAAAGAGGFLVGGVLTEALGWRAVLWVNVPISALLAGGVLVTVRSLPPEDRSTRLDLPGAALLTAAVMSVVAGAALAETPERRLRGAALVTLGLALAAGFVARQRAAAVPLIPPAAFTSRNLRSGTGISFVNTATTSSTAVLATLWLQEEEGASPVEAGLSLMALSLAVIPGSAACGPLARRLSMRALAAVGLLLVGTGCAVLAVTGGAWAPLVVGMAVSGLGLGASSVAANAVGTDVDDALTGSATGVVNTGAQLGTALGVAAAVLLAAGGPYGPLSGPAAAWAACAAAAVACAAWAAAGGRRPVGSRR